MNRLNEMWATLEAYLPQAVAKGHGKSWARMCEEKTANASDDAAYDAAANAFSAAAYAAYAASADDATSIAASAAGADYWAQKAIGHITNIMEKNS